MLIRLISNKWWNIINLQGILSANDLLCPTNKRIEPDITRKQWTCLSKDSTCRNMYTWATLPVVHWMTRSQLAHLLLGMCFAPPSLWSGKSWHLLSYTIIVASWFVCLFLLPIDICYIILPNMFLLHHHLWSESFDLNHYTHCFDHFNQYNHRTKTATGQTTVKLRCLQNGQSE